MEDDIQSLSLAADGVSVHSGFPNPAVDRRGQKAMLALDINQLLVRHPSSTYLFKVSGHANTDQGIYDGDVAVIDRALPSRGSDLVIMTRDDNFLICRRHQLLDGDQLWGVVVAIIHKYR